MVGSDRLNVPAMDNVSPYFRVFAAANSHVSPSWLGCSTIYVHQQRCTKRGAQGVTPPPPLSLVGPNFSHHKARVQAVGWSPLGTWKQGSRPFAAPPPPPPQQKWGRKQAQHSPPPPACPRTPAPSLQAVTW